jgi:hypothetical protein
LALFSRLPIKLASALACLIAVNAENLRSASVIALAFNLLTFCLIGNTLVFNCVANLSSSAFTTANK